MMPLYNNGDEKYPESTLFCGNSKCARLGLLTVVFTPEVPDEKKASKKGSKNGKRKSV